MGVYGINNGNRYYNNYAYNNSFRSLPVQRGYVYQPSVRKKEGPSAGKIFLGLVLGALTVAGIIMAGKSIHNAKHPEEVLKKSFSKIFGRDISIEEAQKLAEKYKQIYKIEDKKEFAQAMFKQLKIDCGLDKTKLQLRFAGKELTNMEDVLAGFDFNISSEFLSKSKAEIGGWLTDRFRYTLKNKNLLQLGEDEYVKACAEALCRMAHCSTDNKKAAEFAKKVYTSTINNFGVPTKIIKNGDNEYALLSRLSHEWDWTSGNKSGSLMQRFFEYLQ